MAASLALSLSISDATMNPDHSAPCCAAIAITTSSSVTKMIKSLVTSDDLRPSFWSKAGPYSEARANVHVPAEKSMPDMMPPVSWPFASLPTYRANTPRPRGMCATS